MPKKIVDVVDFDYKEGKKRNRKPSETKRQCQDNEKVNRQKAKAGEEAEQAVMIYEANRLKNLGRSDLIAQIDQVSKKSSDYGYDITSYDVVDGKIKEIHIEVKSAKYINGKIEFFISEAELNKCKEDQNYKIYALLNFGNKNNYRLHIIKRDKFISDDKYLSPITYVVSIPADLIEN